MFALVIWLSCRGDVFVGAWDAGGEKTAAQTGFFAARRRVWSLRGCAGKNPFFGYAYGWKVLEITP